MPTNMSLIIAINLTGSQDQSGAWHLTPTYAQTSTMPPSPDVVTADGSIDLTRMLETSDYNNATEINFNINSDVVDKNGARALVAFPGDRRTAITFTPPSAEGDEFSHFGDDGSEYALTFLDKDDDSGNYEYCLTVTCYENGATTGTNVTLDPRIVNRQSK